MEPIINTKTATRYPHLDDEAKGLQGWYLSEPFYSSRFVQARELPQVVSEEAAFLYGEEAKGRLWKFDLTAVNVAGETQPGYLQSRDDTIEQVLESLGYRITAPLPLPAKPKRPPPRTHLNVAHLDFNTRLPVGEKPACGQLNGVKTGHAQTFYTLDPDKVTCQRCVTTKAFAKALALAQIEPEVKLVAEAMEGMDFSKHAVEGSVLAGAWDDIDVSKQAWNETLAEHADFLYVKAKQLAPDSFFDVHQTIWRTIAAQADAKATALRNLRASMAEFDVSEGGAE